MSHCVMELMVVPFPEGYGASVHFAWPNKDYISLGVYVLYYLLFTYSSISSELSCLWSRRIERCRNDETCGEGADNSLTNSKPSAIYRLRSHLPPDAPLPTSTPGPAANLGIEIASLPQLEQLLSTVGGAAEGRGKEVAGKVDVGKVAEKVVKNVRPYSNRLACSLSSNSPVPLCCADLGCPCPS